MELKTVLTSLATAGYIAVGIGVLVARGSPATGFEMSIYAGTPFVFWLCACFGLVVSVAVVFASHERTNRYVGALLGGVSMMAIVSVPVVRGYQYVGIADSLSHLGTAADINTGALTMLDSRYPVVHTVGSVLHDATGLALTHVLLLVVVIYVGCFFLFVPLATRELTRNATITYVSLFAGLLLLPLNHLSPSLYIHPTSQALMYAPIPLFAFFALYRHRNWRSSILFLLVMVTTILLHPQQAANLVAFGAVVAIYQIGTDLYDGAGLSAYRSWIAPEVAVVGVVFWLWVRRLEAFWNNIEALARIPFADTTPAESTVSRGLSLTEVGGSLAEVFFKLFFVSLLFAVLTVIAMGIELSRRKGLFSSTADLDSVSSDGGTDRLSNTYAFYGLGAVGLIFVVYLVGGISDQYFRQLGMLMVFATILGSIAVGRALSYIAARRSLRLGRATVSSFILVCLVLTVPVVFASPYIYYHSDHVTESQMEGYGTSFEHRDSDIGFVDIRTEAARYGHAIQGRQIPTTAYYERTNRTVPNHFAGRALPEYYEEPTYLPVTDLDRTVDPVLWEGFRYSRRDFAYLERDPGINRVQSNGGYELYLISE